jgi:YHS domain-containing protein
VPLAAVLWRGGISFGGVVSFIFADLIVLPIIDIYRRYYTPKVALYITVTFYAAMAAAGYVVELLFAALGIVPSDRSVGAIGENPTLNYTSVLNVIFLVFAFVLVVHFLRTGGMAMLRSMNGPGDGGHGGETMARDPVCGMSVDPAHAPSSEFGGATYYFCSEGDKRAFDANPEQFAAGGRPRESGGEHHHGR